MKTEKEQIKVMTKDEIKKALETCTDIYAPCNGCPYETCTNCDATLHTDAIKLITEQEKEIERLKAENDANMQYIRMMGIQSHIKTSNEQVKQAKIDVLNKVKNYIDDKIENDYGDMSDSVNYLTIDIDDFDDFIDELIAEVKDEHSNN